MTDQQRLEQLQGLALEFANWLLERDGKPRAMRLARGNSLAVRACRHSPVEATTGWHMLSTHAVSGGRREFLPRPVREFEQLFALGRYPMLERDEAREDIELRVEAWEAA